MPVPMLIIRFVVGVRTAAPVATAALELLASGPASERDRVRVAQPTLIPRRSTTSVPTR